MGVGEGGGISVFRLFRRIARGFRLHPAVADGPAIPVNRQGLRGVCPACIFRQEGFIHLFPVRPEDHLNRSGPYAVLVVVIFPDLINREDPGLRHMGVGDNRNAAVCIGFCPVARHVLFLPAVPDILSVFLKRQVLHPGFPAA